MALQLTQEEFERLQHMKKKHNNLSNRGSSISEEKQLKIYTMLHNGYSNRDIVDNLRVSRRTVIRYRHKWGLR